LPLLFWSLQSPFATARACATFALTPFYAFLPSGTLQVIILLLLGAAAHQLRAHHRPGAPGSPGGREADFTAHPGESPHSGAPA
jgi:hypothetical protein